VIPPGAVNPTGGKIWEAEIFP